MAACDKLYTGRSSVKSHNNSPLPCTSIGLYELERADRTHPPLGRLASRSGLSETQAFPRPPSGECVQLPGTKPMQFLSSIGIKWTRTLALYRVTRPCPHETRLTCLACQYWISEEPEYGQQGVLLENRFDDNLEDLTDPSTWSVRDAIGRPESVHA